MTFKNFYKHFVKLQKAAVSRRIDEVNSQFTDFEEMVHELTSTLHSIEKESDELTAQLEALRHKDRIELKKKLQSSQNLKHTLEREVNFIDLIF